MLVRIYHFLFVSNNINIYANSEDIINPHISIAVWYGNAYVFIIASQLYFSLKKSAIITANNISRIGSNRITTIGNLTFHNPVISTITHILIPDTALYTVPI